MLKSLRRIVQEVSGAEDLASALGIIVQRVRAAMETQACSVFLVDEQTSEHVLMATEGLNVDLVRQFRLKLGEGLVGLVGEREEPINLDDAPTHPKFRQCDEIGEEPYHAFLGVPIIHQRDLLGVLVVQQRQPRRFDESEEAFLVTLSAQLAGVIAHAEAAGQVGKLMVDAASQQPASLEEVTLTGIPSVPGVGIGTAVLVYPLADLEAVPDKKITDSKAEIASFETALEAARAEIRGLSEGISSSLPEEERALFDAYLKILESTSLIDAIHTAIREGSWAQGALRRVIKQRVRQFAAMEDPYLRERASDLKDLGRRVLSHLQSRQPVAMHYPERTVLVGEEVTPAALAAVPEGRLAGVVSAVGSGYSHIAILARAMGVPTVMGAEDLPVGELEGRELIIDGYYGQVYISPSAAVRQEFIGLAEEERELDAELERLQDLPAETLDGYAVSMMVNTGLAADVGRSLRVGAEGVGLYRTEVPFMQRDRFPSEEEQRVIYQQLLTTFAPRSVVMRTLDVGGDKLLPYFPIEEANPFLGWRGIRITLDHPEVFLLQIRAMLRASVDLNNLSILLPMISSVSEVEEALRLIHKAHDELVEDGVAVQMPPVGAMIEVPSAVFQAQDLARRVDFLSVGSNDLTQYILAVDRNNARVASLYDGLHPAVLRALRQVVNDAHCENKTISLCGEMAADPPAVILLLAMGFDTLSLNATHLPRMKWVIRKFTMERARMLLEEVMAMDDPVEIRCHMELALEEAGLAGLIRAGK